MAKYVTRTMQMSKYNVLYYDMERKVAVEKTLSCYDELLDKKTYRSIDLKGKAIMEENGVWDDGGLFGSNYKILSVTRIETEDIKLQMDIKTFVQYAEKV